ncbi:MAG: DUF6452 family protein [Aestuariibaculum sp.]
MKLYFKYILLIIATIAILSNISCERDDICAESTGTTPKLIIDAYDNSNTENKKNIAGLLIKGIDNDAILPGYEIISSNSIELPLKTDNDNTQYVLIKGASVNDNDTPDDTNDDYIDGNYDTITVAYTRKEIYVSRACGYKTIFENVSLTIEEDGDNWIISRLPLMENNTVEDETETHFNIYH